MREISVIVPTRALAPRADLIRRALRSILTQEQVRPVALVVVNGTDRDPGLIRELQADKRLSLTFRDQAHLPGALRAGREQVVTPYVTTLDDDDEMLPGALASRVAALEANPEWDAVVTNGLVRHAQSEVLKIPDIEAVRRDPLGAMLRKNWLMPGAWLCRTEVMAPEVFEAMPAYLECTYMGLWLATHCRLGFLEAPTVARGKDTPASVSKSREYVLGQAAALRQLLELDLPADIKATLRPRISGACHTSATRCLADGEYAAAWAWHLRSLVKAGGWRYATYTARLILVLGRKRT